MALKTAACLLLAASLLPRALAHVPFYEVELLSGTPQGDWTLQAPFEIQLSAAKGWSPSLQASKALYSLLGFTPGDTYDAAAFTVTPDAPPQYIVGLQALVPACPAYAAFFPTLALLGPATDPRFLPPDAATAALLPFPVPLGYGLILRSQPQVANRSVYADNPVQSYLLPSPVTPACLPSPEAFAACGGGSAAQTSIISQLPGRDAPLQPGRYFIAWWDPARVNPTPVGSRPQEVIVSFGTGETTTPKEKAIQVAAMTGQVRPQFVSPCVAAGARAAGAAAAPPGAE